MRRTITLYLAGLFAIGAIVLITLILPPVQRWLMLAALESPGMSRLEIGSVRIWPGSILIEDLVIEKQGMRLAFDRASVRGSLWRAAMGGTVHLQTYELGGMFLAVDAEEIGQHGIRDSLIDAAIILAPFAFELDQANLAGVLEVRLALEQSLSIRLVGQGEGFGAAQTGRLRLDGEMSGEGWLAEPVPFGSDIMVRREDGFRRIESNLKGILGGEEPIAEFSSDLTHEYAVTEAKGALSVDIRRMDELLIGPEAGRLSSGQGELTFDWAANASGESVAEGLIVATELASNRTGYRIGRVEAPFRLAVAPGSSLSLRTPVEVKRKGFDSDLLVELTAVVDEPNWRLDGRLSGNQIRADDLAGLGVFFTTTPDPIDPVPAWGGIRGRLGLQFGRVEVQSGIALRSFSAEIQFADDHVGIHNFDSRMGGGSLTGEATLGFDPMADDSYDFYGAWSGNKIQLEKLGLATQNAAGIEGSVDLDLSFQATAPNLPMIGDRVSGMARIIGGPGVYRGLSQHARSASSVAGFLGTLFRSEDFRTLSELSNELAEIHYDTLEIEAAQSAGEGLEISRLLLQGPEVKLYGRGRVASRRPAELLTSPMRFDFNLGAKGRFAELLGAVGLVSAARRDWEGYAFMSEPVSVVGTLENPDISGLWGLLRKATVNAFR